MRPVPGVVANEAPRSRAWPMGDRRRSSSPRPASREAVLAATMRCRHSGRWSLRVAALARVTGQAWPVFLSCPGGEGRGRCCAAVFQHETRHTCRPSATPDWPAICVFRRIMAQTKHPQRWHSRSLSPSRDGPVRVAPDVAIFRQRPTYAEDRSIGAGAKTKHRPTLVGC